MAFGIQVNSKGVVQYRATDARATDESQIREAAQKLSALVENPAVSTEQKKASVAFLRDILFREMAPQGAFSRPDSMGVSLSTDTRNFVAEVLDKADNVISEKEARKLGNLQSELSADAFDGEAENFTHFAQGPDLQR